MLPPLFLVEVEFGYVCVGPQNLNPTLMSNFEFCVGTQYRFANLLRRLGYVSLKRRKSSIGSLHLLSSWISFPHFLQFALIRVVNVTVFTIGSSIIYSRYQLQRRRIKHNGSHRFTGGKSPIQSSRIDE